MHEEESSFFFFFFAWCVEGKCGQYEFSDVFRMETHESEDFSLKITLHEPCHKGGSSL